MQEFVPFPLFDRINIQNSEDFEKLIEDLNNEQSTFIIQIALEKAYNSGIFSLSESEILSKALRLNNKKENNQI
jgi:hypothetical protein